MRFVKIAAWAVGALLALLLVAVTLIVVFVDPNDYRDRIASVVEQHTGRTLTLSGDLKLSFIPWLALQTGPATLSERAGFGDEPFVSIEGARVSVRLWPLLRGQLEVGKLTLNGARIRLITDANGRTNWSDLAERNQAEAAPTDQPTRMPTIAGLEINDASITMENRQTRSRRVVRDFNLQTGRFESGQPFDLKAGFVLDQDASLSIKVHLATTVTADLESNVHRLAEPEIDVTVLGQGYPPDGIPVQVRAKSLSADIGRKAYQLDGPQVKATWKGDGFPDEGLALAAQAQHLAANLADQTLELSELGLDIAGARLTGELHGKEILDAPRISGPLRLDPVSPREWLPTLGIKVPATRDPQVLQKLTFSSQVALTGTSADLTDVTLQLDDTTARGSLGIANFANRAVRFDLDIDRIDADRYLAPVAAPEKQKPAQAAPSAPVDIPIEALRSLNARGEVRVGEARFAGLTFTKLRLGVNARDGQVRLHPSQASMYGGTYNGDIGIDATSDQARVSLNEQVRGVDFAPLFRDLFQKERISGKGNANLKASGAGRTSDDLLRTLDGNVDFNVADGALEGADLWYEIERARAVLKQQAIPARTGPARTTFDSFQGSGVLNDGVLSTHDLDVSTHNLKVTGQGTANIPKRALDLQLMATVLKTSRTPADADAAQLQELVDAQIPVRVTGTFDEPKVRPDIEGMVKGRVKEELKKQEEKLKDKLGEKLKDLFGR